PFNVQKSILILLGCHRVGQYLLEDWLQSPDSIPVLQRWQEDLTNYKRVAGQIALHARFVNPSTDAYTFYQIGVTKNTARTLPYFPLTVHPRRNDDESMPFDTRVASPQDIVDISLII